VAVRRRTKPAKLSLFHLTELSPSQNRYLVTYFVNLVYHFLFINSVCSIIVLASAEREKIYISVQARGVCNECSGKAEHDGAE
jgi:hypothetical protein